MKKEIKKRLRYHWGWGCFVDENNDIALSSHDSAELAWEMANSENCDYMRKFAARCEEVAAKEAATNCA